jgi:hypothetical protein
MIDLDNKPFWYGGILSLTLIKGIMRMELESDGLAVAKQQFDSLVESSEGLISIFYHPCEYSTEEFWDAVNFNRGTNTPRECWKRSRLRGSGQMQFYVDMLGQFVDHMLRQGSEFITTAQLVESSYFGSYDAYPDYEASDVTELAGLWGSGADYAVYRGYSLSASEVFSLFRAALCGQPLRPQLLYGPEQDIPTQEGARGTAGEYTQALHAGFPAVFGFPQLPDSFMVNGKRVNPVDMACTLAHIIRTKPADGQIVDTIHGSLNPQRHINASRDWGQKWIIFPEDFMVDRLLKTASLQAWTLKPALWPAGRRH